MTLSRIDDVIPQYRRKLNNAILLDNIFPTETVGICVRNPCRFHFTQELFGDEPIANRGGMDAVQAEKSTAQTSRVLSLQTENARNGIQ